MEIQRERFGEPNPEQLCSGRIRPASSKRPLAFRSSVEESWKKFSGEELFEGVSGNVRQSGIAAFQAVGDFGVIDAEAVEREDSEIRRQPPEFIMPSGPGINCFHSVIILTHVFGLKFKLTHQLPYIPCPTSCPL